MEIWTNGRRLSSSRNASPMASFVYRKHLTVFGISHPGVYYVDRTLTGYAIQSTSEGEQWVPLLSDVNASSSSVALK